MPSNSRLLIGTLVHLYIGTFIHWYINSLVHLKKKAIPSDQPFLNLKNPNSPYLISTFLTVVSAATSFLGKVRWRIPFS